MRFAAILLVACLAATTSSHAQSSQFSSLLSTSEERIEAGLQEYKTFLSGTSEEKLALISEINSLENELVTLRSEEQKAQRSAQTLKLDLAELEERISAMDTQAQYTSGVLSEYLNNFESRLHISEDQSYREPLFQIRTAVEQNSENSSRQVPLYFDTIEHGMQRLEELLGGKHFTGRAITPTGGVKEGEILLLGPSAYFHANDNSESGFLEFNPGTIEPGLVPLAQDLAQPFAPIFDTGSGLLVFDSSQGKANLLKQAKGSLLEHLQKGGWVGYAILALGALSILIALIKIFDLRSTRVQTPDNLAALSRTALEQGPEAGAARIRSIHGPVSDMLRTGLEFAQANAETNLEAMEAIILKLKPKLQRFLPFLATTAAVAPLMGLLGTVVGMIKTFTLIEVFGTGDAKSLSSGISEALITTELGLVVAIPALIFHGLFTRVMRSRTSAMEQIAADFSRQLSKEKTVATDDQRARVI